MTKYRRDVLTHEHLNLPQPVPSKVRADFGADLTELNGEDDHVHPLVEQPPQVPASKLVNSLNGVSPRQLRQQFRIRTHRNHLRSPSYFTFSCGGAPSSIIRQYVENQRHPQLTARYTGRTNRDRPSPA